MNNSKKSVLCGFLTVGLMFGFGSTAVIAQEEVDLSEVPPIILNPGDTSTDIPGPIQDVPGPAGLAVALGFANIVGLNKVGDRLRKSE